MSNVIKKVIQNWTEYQIYAWWWAAGAGDVTWPSSATNWHLAVFDWATGKVIKDWGAVPTVPTDVSAFNNDSWYLTSSTWVTTVNGNSWAVTVTEFSPWTWSTWQVVTKTANWYWYANIPSQVSDTAYGSGWNWVTTTAPSKNAVYDKINSIDWVIPSAATTSNQLADKNYVDDSINSVTAYYITKNAAGDQFATYSQLSSATTFYSGWVARVPTRNDYTIVLADENHDNATTRYIYNSGWEYQYTINESAMTQSQLDALNSGITSTKVTTYDGYASTIAWKQDTLSTQTAYSSKGTATKVPKITTNTLWQVTAISETNITFPVTSVNNSTWAVTVNAVPWTWTTWHVLTKTASGYAFSAAPVTSVWGSTWAVGLKTVNWNSLVGSWNITISWWITNETTGTTSTVTKIWAGTEAQYTALSSKSANTIYFTF